MSEIFLGLDIGTSSCGWALTNDSYELQKIKGKDAWGVRLFEEAETKADRRLKRTNRRRMVRKKLQDIWLRELFENEVEKVDEKFFSRLKYSNLWKEDKLLMDEGLNSKYSLFNDVLKTVYNDRNYYEDYKTVYHLRKKLLTQPADDIRLLYLAVHSILTHRGHFLSGASLDENDNQNSNTLALVQELFKKVAGLSENEPFELKCDNLDFIDHLLQNFENLKSIRAVKEKLIEELGTKTKLEKEIASIFVTGKSSTDKLFARIEKDEKIDFEFDSDKFEDETYGKLVSQLDDDELAVIDLLKTVFSTVQLRKVLGKNYFISEAMVEKHERHNSQLKEFKTFVKKYYPDKMSVFFRQQKVNGKKDEYINNYAKYINYSKVNGKKRFFDKTATREDFYKFIKKQLEEKPKVDFDAEEFEIEKQKFIDLIDKNDFLLKIRSRENAVIPNSLYIKELKQILKTSSEKFEFLNKSDETGLSVADKIISIVEFRVPYFVGPIGNYPETERVNGWAVKENNLPLRPWTLSKIVNFDKAEDMFIQRMTNKCTYLLDEDVLPKDSLLYSKFRVLNELNNLKINGNAISVQTKQLIFNKLFTTCKKVTVKKLKDFLRSENIISKDEIAEIVISGIDREFANNYASFVTLKERFGEEFISEHFDDFEKIIQYHTIFSDKSRLEKRIAREFSYFSADEIKFLKSLNFSKWGRLSKKFLKGVYFVDKKTGELTNVLDAMWNTNFNLMELMGSGFTLSEKLSERVSRQERDLIYEDVEELYCSPSVKRGAWQAIQLINEIKKYTGKYPDKIFVEVTRDDETKGDNGRKDSRHKQLTKLYNSKDLKSAVSKYTTQYNKLMEELNQKSDNSKLRSDRLFLYFLQLGKCMYTGEPIDIKDIYNDNLYDIDHIIPQSKIKDDSLNNKVLVKKDANRSKGDVYPICEIHPDWVQKQKSFWEMLQKMGMMSDDKLSRLLRTNKFTNSDANDFVNRQLVTTNQETKAVIDLLKKVMDKPNNIVFSKAKFASMFRKKYHIYKSRNVNNFHHAKDAYLNIVVGDVLRNRFTNGFWKREEDDVNRKVTANIEKLFDFTVRSASGTVVWNGYEDVRKIQSTCDKNTCIVTYMPTTNANGMFYDETIYKSLNKSSDSKASINLKGNTSNPLSSIEKYGGYNSMKNAYFMVVESLDKKGKLQKTIEAVPILINYKYRNDKDKQKKIIEYIEQENDIKITRVMLDKLKYQSLLKIDGGLYRLTGKTGDKYKIQKAMEWHIDNKMTAYTKVIDKYLAMDEDTRKELTQTQEKIIVSPAKKENQRELYILRNTNIELYDLIVKQLSKSIYNISSIQGVLEQLKTQRQSFIELSIENQAILLGNLVRYVGGEYMVDLKLIGGAEKSGATTINKKITDKNISLICQSVSGIFQKEIKL